MTGLITATALGAAAFLQREVHEPTSFEITQWTKIGSDTIVPFAKRGSLSEEKTIALTLTLGSPVYVSSSSRAIPQPSLRLHSRVQVPFKCIMRETIDRPIDALGIYMVTYQAECGPLVSNEIMRIWSLIAPLVPRLGSVADEYKELNLEFPRAVTSALQEQTTDANHDSLFGQMASSQSGLPTGLVSSSFSVSLRDGNTSIPLIIQSTTTKGLQKVTIHLESLPDWSCGSVIAITTNPGACFDVAFPFEPCSNATVVVPLIDPIAFTTNVESAKGLLDVRVVFSDQVLGVTEAPRVALTRFTAESLENENSGRIHVSTASPTFKGQLAPTMFTAYRISEYGDDEEFIPVISVRRILDSKSSLATRNDSYIVTLDAAASEFHPLDRILLNVKEKSVVGLTPPGLFVRPRATLLSLPSEQNYNPERKKILILYNRNQTTWPEI